MIAKLVKIILGLIIITSTFCWAEVKPLYIQADTMEAFQNQNLVVFKGNVKASQNGVKLYADLMKVFYTKSQKSNSQKDFGKVVERVEAEGHVVIIQEDRKALGEKAVFYRFPEEKIILTGNARIEDLKNLILGEEITILLKEKKMVIKGTPVKATIKSNNLPQNFSTMNMKHVLRVNNLTKTYHGKRIVDNLSLSVQSGEIVGLLGPNGAGKTTTFYMIIGIINPEKGKVYLDDEDITSQPMYIRARKGLNYLPQEASVFRKMSVEENILAILETLGISPEQMKEKLQSLLKELCLEPLAKNRASTLSGGERRRLEITRALVTSPIFMILDEPFAGIDPIAVSEIKEIVCRLKSQNIGILISDHNVRETLRICDRAYILNKGKILEAGTPLEIANSALAKEFYLGADFTL